MWLLYNLAIHVYGDAIRLASLFNPKARLWVEGRKGIFRELESAISSQQSAVSSRQSAVGSRQSKLQTPNSKPGQIAWFHCASLGEFEQGRPVIEAFRASHPGWKILLTFFSPSGYQVRKNYASADWVFYLPLDSPGNARKFLQIVRPSMAVFIKYEFWLNYFDQLHRHGTPFYIISANFRPGQHIFKWYGAWFRKQLRKATHYFVQHENSAHLLRNSGIPQVTVSGDTRFDRVIQVKTTARGFPLIEEFSRQMSVFVAGSTWPEDEELIRELIVEYEGRMKFIIAPHEVERERVLGLKSAVSSRQSAVGSRQSGVVLFSELNPENVASARVIIVDGIGYLSHLYQYAHIAYIGGGFGAGIHNILEAATFGKPVIFGPKYHKFREAVELIGSGGAFSIDNYRQLHDRTQQLLENNAEYAKSSLACLSYVNEQQGATNIILKEIGLIPS